VRSVSLKPKQIGANPKIKDWLKQFSKESETYRVYPFLLSQFLRDTGLNADKLLEMAKNEPTKLRSIIYGYLRGLRKSDKTKLLVLSAVKSFIKYYLPDYDIKKPRFIRSVPKKFDYIPSQNEVSLLIERAPINLKPCIALMAYCGMRPSDIVELRFRNVMDEIKWNSEKQCYEPLKKPMKIVVREKKTGMWYVTFLGAKGSRILAAYLTHRRKQLNRELEPEDKLFIYNNAATLSVMIIKMIKEVASRNPTAFHRFRPYSLRKYFRNAVRGLDEGLAEYLMGHVSGLRSLESVYLGLSGLDPRAVENLREDFKKVLPNLEGEVPAEYVTTEVEALLKQVEHMRNFLLKLLPEALRTDEDLLWLQRMIQKRLEAKTKRELREIQQIQTETVNEVTSKMKNNNHKYIIVKGEEKMLVPKGTNW